VNWQRTNTFCCGCWHTGLLAGPEPNIAGWHLDAVQQLHDRVVYGNARCNDVLGTRQGSLLGLTYRAATQVHAGSKVMIMQAQTLLHMRNTISSRCQAGTSI
jgi:hypothetical protein